MRILLREHRTIAIRTYSVPDLEESQGLFTSIERICGSTGSCAAHALTWRSRPCMALGKWIQQHWLQIVAEIATEHPNVVTRLLWPCTRCFVDNSITLNPALQRRMGQCKKECNHSVLPHAHTSRAQPTPAACMG